MTEQHKRLYKTQAWKKVRLDVIARDKSICYFCGKVVGKRATVHHIEELNESNWLDWDVALNPDNLVCCHPYCHDIHHERFGYKPTIVNDDLSINYSKRRG